MRRLVLFLAIVASLQTLHAQNATFPRHEIRVGWGDMLYETAVYRNTPSRQNVKYAGHFFGEYQYNFNRWLGVGFEADFERVTWDTQNSSGQNFHNITFMPTARFTYFRKGIVTMYGGLGLGLTINGGSETDFKGRTTACAPCIGLTAYGISVAWNKLFAAFELGGLNAFINHNEVYMAGSRLLSLSIGIRL